MYCQKCGKEITESSVFCTWCGTKQEIPASQPVDIPEKRQEQVAEQTAAVGIEAAETPSEPIPSGEKIQEDRTDSVTNAQENKFSGEISMEEKPEKPHKYYTTAHIVICLAVAGIMAAAAGVFAGLYFSVIG